MHRAARREAPRCARHPRCRAARAAGVHPILMMNDPDEAMRLTSLNPAGGIVSLHELPDFVRFLLANRQAVS